MEGVIEMPCKFLSVFFSSKDRSIVFFRRFICVIIILILVYKVAFVIVPVIYMIGIASIPLTMIIATIIDEFGLKGIMEIFNNFGYLSLPYGVIGFWFIVTLIVILIITIFAIIFMCCFIKCIKSVFKEMKKNQ